MSILTDLVLELLGGGIGPSTDGPRTCRNLQMSSTVRQKSPDVLSRGRPVANGIGKQLEVLIVRREGR